MALSHSQLLADRWQGHFQGRLLSREDEFYSAACRIWNGMIDRRPALIARCESSADVRAAIQLAQAEHLPLSVRGGGHGVAGNALCHDGLTIDLSRMQRVDVDAERREAIAQPGVLWGGFDAATGAHGLATTGGQVSHTGIAGLTLGGGLGYLMGKYGAVCDNLLAVELVTADGEVLTVSEDENAELFWAVRGAGANFGIVTSFRYRLHALPQVLAGLLLHPRERAPELFAFYREFLRGTPDELDTTFAYMNAPDGTPLVAVVAVYAGDPDEGARLLAPLRAFGPPIADLIQPMPYAAAQGMIDAGVPIGNRYYWKSSFGKVLTDDLGAVLKSSADAMASPLSMILLFEIKGAIQRVAKDAMAFDHRDENFEMSIIAQWTDPAADEANIRWTRESWHAAQPFVSQAVYANHMTADESEERVRAAYGSKYERLAGLKAKYDPTNLFRMNHNIPPLTAG